MTLDALVFWMFTAGLLTGIGLVLMVLATIDEVWIIRYRLRHRRRPPGEPKPL